MPELIFYYSSFCGFCRRVTDYMEENGITADMKNINESSDIRNALIQIGGKSQVPCLVVNGEVIYESKDIIQWFEKNWKK